MRPSLLHYIVGGIVSIFIAKAIGIELNIITIALCFIFWPFVFVFGLVIGIVRLISALF